MRSLALKWIASLVVGAFFVWLSARDGRFGRLIELGVEFDWPFLKSRGAGIPLRLDDVSAGLFAALPDGPGWILDVRYLGAYFLVLSLIHILRVARWGPLLQPFGRIPYGTLNRVGAVGFMCTFLFPLRLGELVRPYLLNREFPKIAMSTILATIVVERLADGLVVTLMLYAALLYLPDGMRTTELQLAGYSALAVFLGGLVFMGALYWQRERTTRFAVACVRRFSVTFASRVEAMVGSFTHGLAVLPALRPLGEFLALTVVYWALNGLGLWVFASGFFMTLPIALCYAMMACVVIGMMIPNSPGNVGSFWYFLLLPLGIYSLGPDVLQLTVYGLAVYALQLIQQSGFGVWYLITGKVAASELAGASHAAEELAR